MLMFGRAIALVLASFVAGHAAPPVSTPAGAPDDVRLIGVEGEGAGTGRAGVDRPGRGTSPGRTTWTPGPTPRTSSGGSPVPGRGHSSPIVWKDHIFLTTARDGGAKVSMLALPAPTASCCGRTTCRRRASNTTTEEQPRVGDAGDRRPARLRVVRHARPRRVRFHGQAGLAREARRPQQLSRQRRIAGALQGPLFIYQDHDGTSTLGSFVAAFDARTGDVDVEDRSRRDRRLGHAGRHQRRHPRRAHRQQPAPGHAYDPSTGAELWTRARQDVRSDSDAGRRSRPGVLLVGPRRARRSRSAGRQRRRHRDARRVDVAARIAVRAVGDAPRRSALHDQRHAEHPDGLDAKTGQAVYQERLGEPMREGFSSSPVAVGDKLFFTNDDGQTFVVAGRPDVQAAARQRAERAGAGLAGAGRRDVVLADGQGVDRDWQVTSGAPTPSDPSRTEGHVHRGPNLHLVRPRIILGQFKKRDSLRTKAFEERFDVGDTDPHPGARIALITLAKHDRLVIAGDGGHVAPAVAAPVDRKPKGVDVVPRLA